jgi:hypothetical protein
MKNWGIWLYGLVLAGLVGLVFVFPAQMISPGELMSAHQSLAGDCAACHAPFQGAVASRCISCHTVASIGLKSTKGAIIPAKAGKVAFHQSLKTQNCLTCHTDHVGTALTALQRPTFNHALLDPKLQTQCATCHAAPTAPFHAHMKGQCRSCHTQTAWKPATFDHSRFFALTGPHDVACGSCHIVANDYSQYSCTTCHEHAPARIAAQHAEEGITNTTNCVSCHRSAHMEGEGRGQREEREED